MGKLGDLWIRLGLKKENFDKGIEQAKSKVTTFAESAKGVGTKFKALWAAIGVGALALVNDFAHHSQKFGDLWEHTMSRMKGAWGQFLTSLTNWDWDGFWDRVKAGADAAQKSTAAHDAEFEVENSLSIRKAAIQEELALLQVEMRNTKNSYEERAKYAQQYLDKVAPLYAEEIKLREGIAKEDLNEYLSQAGLSQNVTNRDNLTKFLTDIAPSEDMTNTLIAWTKRNQGKTVKWTNEMSSTIDKISAQYGDAATSAFGVLAKYYMGSGDKEAQKVVDALTAMYSAKAAFNEQTRRVQTVLNTAEAQSGGIDSSGVDGGGSSAASEDPQMQLAEDILERLRENSQTEVEILTEKYEQEKAILEKFGLDSSALTNEYLDNILNLNGDYLDEIISQCEEFEPVEIEPIKMKDDALDEVTENLKKQFENGKKLTNAFNDAIVSGFSAGMQELTDQLFGLKDVNAGAIFAALLTPLADMAIREGEILMAQGAGVEACKKALESLEGWGAIAAGAALVAIGTAAKSGLSALASTSSTGTTTTASAGASSSGSSTQQIESSMTIYVEGRISGSDIVISGQRTANSWSR